ncbi:MAG: DUF6675 family protein [Spirochaetota bacterium]
MSRYCKQTIFITYLFLIIAAFAFAEERISADKFFSKTEKETLRKGNIITKSYLKYNGIVHTSGTDAQISFPATGFIGKETAEYEMICIEKAFFPFALNDKTKLSIYNTLAAPSKLSGMRYYSKTSGKTGKLITGSQHIDSTDMKKPLKDTVYTAISPKTVLYFKTTDNRFGSLLFRSEIYNDGDNFILKNVCIQPMEKYFILINNKEEYQLVSFFIYDKESKGYFYYSINAMRIRNDYFLKRKLLSAENFANRMRGSTVHIAKFLGLDWKDRLKAFE